MISIDHIENLLSPKKASFSAVSSSAMISI